MIPLEESAGTRIYELWSSVLAAEPLLAAAIRETVGKKNHSLVPYALCGAE